jgi:ABC-2 type transport system ATP-binding protein
MSNVIVADQLVKAYGPRRVVDHLSLAVPQGSVYALLGDNGAGKSTTIKILNGQIPADAGRATILGQDCWADATPLRHRVGYVPERPRFYDWMTVYEIGWFAGGFHRAGFVTRYMDAVARFGLDAKARLKNLSKGGYAKVGLALALAPDPEVLILDEPTSGLDLFTRKEFLASMVDLAGEGRTILISSHGVAEIERVASHAAFLAGGKVLVSGTLDDLRNRIVRLRFRSTGPGVEACNVGVVLEQHVAGLQHQAVVLDPDREMLDSLSVLPGVSELEETPLTLEEMYTALLARYHHQGARVGMDRVGAPVGTEVRP